MIIRFKAHFLTIILLLAWCARATATHLRAGEIIVQAVSCQSLTYRITIIGYTDTGSSVEFGGGVLNFGDGNIRELSPDMANPPRPLGDEVALNTYQTDYTFPAAGQYTISYLEANRNEGIANMDNSVNTTFYIETTIVINPLYGCNSSPVLLNPPVDRACPGVAFFHNPGAVDLDGDSLSYHYVICKQDVGVPVINYSYPDVYDRNVYNALNEDQTGPATYTIDPVTGDVVWNAPGAEGEYNIAFQVREWRKIGGQWQQIGSVTRDMQILVFECDNERPELEVPNDTCITAGDTLKATAIATDPDGDDIIMDSFGEVYVLLSSPAYFSPNPPVAQAPPAELDFVWETNCSHIRNQPYQVRFKALDQPPKDRGQKLASYASWLVNVVGPAPEGLVATQKKGQKVLLEWDSYLCDDYAAEIEVWRRVDSNPFEPENCETGMPASAGYELIDVLNKEDVFATSYVDDNMGNGLEYGATYCYRLVVNFKQPKGGQSYVSVETCIQIEEEEGEFGSLITNVSVLSTSEANGEVLIRWTSPFDIDTVKYPKPYTYELYRGDGFAGGSTLISGGKISDTVFVDTELNTELNVYNYQIVVYDGTGLAVDTTGTASTVRANPSAMPQAIELSWEAHVPWSNVSVKYPTHLIYRDHVIPGNPSQLVLIDSANVVQNGFLYIDDGIPSDGGGLDLETEYCYYVTTRGVYGNDKLSEPFENNSQVICAIPNDTIPPCPPGKFEIKNLNIADQCNEIWDDKPCNFSLFENILDWDYVSSDTCTNDVRSYNIYFSESGEPNSYVLIDNVITTEYIHDGLESYKGCYQIASVDRSGNESERSEPVCNDNCPHYELPNVFTPNEDGLNDSFLAYEEVKSKCPRFVEKVEVNFYNRWGNLIYNYESGGENSVLINWDGTTNLGTKVSAGIYYFHATITFDMLDPNKEKKELKGWVHVTY